MNALWTCQCIINKVFLICWMIVLSHIWMTYSFSALLKLSIARHCMWCLNDWLSTNCTYGLRNVLCFWEVWNFLGMFMRHWVCMCSRQKLTESISGLSPHCLSSHNNFWACVTTMVSLSRATPASLHRWPSFCIVPSIALILVLLHVLGLLYWSLHLAAHLFCAFLTLTCNPGCYLMR